MHMNKPKIMLNKPIYCGVKILDLSKLHMYTFVYEYLKQRYEDKVKIHYGDTDSLIVEVITKNIYDDMLKDSDWFDTSEYPKNHICYSEKNKKVLYKFKDELNGEAMLEHCALKLKMYCNTKTDTSTVEKLKKEDYEIMKEQKEIIELYQQLGYNPITDSTQSVIRKDIITNRKAKGVKKYKAKRFMMPAYKDILFNQDNSTAPEREVTQTLFKVVKHNIYTVKQTKVGLSWFDDKKYFVDKVNQRSLGHYLNFNKRIV